MSGKTGRYVVREPEPLGEMGEGPKGPKEGDAAAARGASPCTPNLKRLACDTSLLPGMDLRPFLQF